MNFDETDEQRMLRDMVREFADEVVRPRSEEIEREHHVPGELLTGIAELGLYGVAVPEEYGGSGLGETGLCIVMEELTKADFSVAVTYGAHASIGLMSVLLGGSDEQKERWLPQMAAGDVQSAYALSEADAGSDPAAMRTTAVRDGDDWVLDGEKVWITHGDRADLVTVYAVTDKQKGAHGGITAFVVPRESDGYTIGKREEKMGQRGSATVTLAFDGVRVPDANRLGPVGEGFKVAMATLDRGRLALAANCLGLRARGAPPVGRLRERARGVRQADRAPASDPVDAGRLRDRDLRPRDDDPADGLAVRRGPAVQPGERRDEAVRDRGARPHRRPGRADPRGHGLLGRVRRREALSRRARHPHLRGHERDPAHRDRARRPEARGVSRPA